MTGYIRDSVKRLSFWRAAVCGLALFFALSAAVHAAGANLEEKMKYERSLEQKVEEVLANLLGPGKSRVMIRATVDFSTKENVQHEGGPGADAEEPAFSWQKTAAGGAKELLPGFSDDSKPASGGGGKYLREVIFPQTMVKRLTVSLVLSDTIPDGEAQKVRQVVTDLLALDQARGDELLLMRATFAPIWYTSEMLGTLIKYGIIALIAIVGMGVVAVGFLKMASAMNSMGGGESGTKISMEMGGLGGAAEQGGLGALPDFSLPKDKAAEAGQPAGKPGDEVIFDIKPDKLEILLRMLSKDAPEDIALIAVHLPQGLRARFISMLPPAVAPEVVASIAKVRFVEPEMITRIKDELERRLNGAVGGYEKAVELIEGAGLKARMGILAALGKSHPEIAAAVRARLLMMDDLDLLEEKDFGIVAGAVPVETWAFASWRMTDAGRARLKAQLAERAWLALQQTVAYGMPPDDKIDAAAEQVLAAAARFMEEGRIKRPPGRNPSVLSAPAAGKVPPLEPASETISDYGR